MVLWLLFWIGIWWINLLSFGMGLILGWCPYCRQAKATLAEFGASYQVYELDQIGNIPLLAPHLSRPSHPDGHDRRTGAQRETRRAGVTLVEHAVA